MKRYNINTCKTYTSQGQEKKSWPQVGTMVHFDASNGKPEGFKIELNMFPGVQFFVFEQKPYNAPGQGGYQEPTVDAETGQVRTPSKETMRRNAPAVVLPGQEKVSSDQIEYPTEEINPDDIPF